MIGFRIRAQNALYQRLVPMGQERFGSSPLKQVWSDCAQNRHTRILDEVVPHINIRSARPQLEKFSSPAAKDFCITMGLASIARCSPPEAATARARSVSRRCGQVIPAVLSRRVDCNDRRYSSGPVREQLPVAIAPHSNL